MRAATRRPRFVAYVRTFEDAAGPLAVEPIAVPVGEVNALNARQNTFGADLTFRWRPLQQGLYKSFILQAELMRQLAARVPFEVPASMIDDWFDTGMIDNPFYNRAPVRLHIIRPDVPLGGGPDGLSFDPAVMQEMLAKGEQAMEAHLTLTDPHEELIG